jgi:uncharacterized membrane protein YjgN (DUF898 family)
MEIISNKAKFYGEGGKYLGIMVVNLILTVVTLGIYYPWARAKALQYLYGETEFAGNRLTFHGTGKEMFKGFIKAVVIVGILYGIYFAAIFSGKPVFIGVGVLVFLIGFLLIIPLAIHGGMRYRMSRTSWKGIHFGYRGTLKELLGIYFKGIFFTIITFGIYGSWFMVNLERYIVSNVRLGNVKFRFDGEGTDLFLINFKLMLVYGFTCGIGAIFYVFWYLRNRNHFFINNLKLEQDGQVYTFQSTLNPGDIFITTFINTFLVIFTLGIGTPWALIRQMRMVMDNIELQGAIDPDSIVQTEENYADATGDDLLSMLDLGFAF